ncbi:MAG: amidohydrolase family protein [Hyphomonadaceae bacterium]|nr:amidohydrolase family protein [Hyphomonadaceae bacterium]
MIFKTLLTGAAALAFTTGAALAQTVAITNAKAWTGTSQGTVDNATIIVVDGAVAEVRTGSAALPSGADVVDADGSWVTPGIIAPFTRIGLVEVGAEDTTNDISAGSSPYSVALKAADGFNPAATTVPITRLEGVTRIIVAPGTGNDLFAGKGMVADTSGAMDSILDDDAFVFIRMGEAGASQAGGSRSAAWTRLRAALSDARTFPARYLSHDAGDALTRVDAQAFGPAARGRQLILVEAHRASDIARLIDLARTAPELNMAIVGGDEAWMVAEDLAESKIPVILDPFQNLPASFQQLGASQENAARLIEAGVVTAFAHLADDGHQARLVLQSAGNAVANGVDHDDALAAITVAPAAIFGLENLGTIAPGAIADLVVWDGDPLEVMSAPTHIFIAGEEQSLESRQTRLRDRYLGLDNGDLPFAYKRGEAPE